MHLKKKDFLWNDSIYKVTQNSIHFAQWIEVFEQTASLWEQRMWDFSECFLESKMHLQNKVIFSQISTFL